MSENGTTSKIHLHETQSKKTGHHKRLVPAFESVHHGLVRYGRYYSLLVMIHSRIPIFRIYCLPHTLKQMGWRAILVVFLLLSVSVGILLSGTLTSQKISNACLNSIDTLKKMGWRAILVVFLLLSVAIGILLYKPAPNAVTINRRFVYDNLILPPGSPDLVREFRSRSTHEPSTHRILEIFASTSEAGTCILDVGCHVGDTTMKLAASAAESVTIIAVDPSADKIAFVDSVLRLNNIHTVRTCVAAISDSHTNGDEVRKGQSGSWTVVEGMAGSIPIRTGEELLGGKIPSLIHLDVEGHEMRAIRGLASVIRKHRPAIMVEIAHGADKAEIRPFLEQTMGYECVWSNIWEQNHLFLPKFQYHIVVVCTPNYNPIGAYGVNSLKAYADRHGYAFTLHTKPIDNGLHLNYTKNVAVLEVMKTSTADFIVSIDADIEIMDPEKTFGSLLWCTGMNRETTAFRAPEDRFTIPWSTQGSLNAGFMMWSNTPRAQEINQRWLDLALGECKQWSCQKPYQQNVFEHCLEPELLPTDRAYLDYREVGMLYSSFILQTRHGSRGWRRMGSPNSPIDVGKM